MHFLFNGNVPFFREKNSMQLLNKSLICQKEICLIFGYDIEVFVNDELTLFITFFFGDGLQNCS